VTSSTNQNTCPHRVMRGARGCSRQTGHWRLHTRRTDRGVSGDHGTARLRPPQRLRQSSTGQLHAHLQVHCGHHDLTHDVPLHRRVGVVHECVSGGGVDHEPEPAARHTREKRHSRMHTCHTLDARRRVCRTTGKQDSHMHICPTSSRLSRCECAPGSHVLLVSVRPSTIGLHTTHSRRRCGPWRQFEGEKVCHRTEPDRDRCGVVRAAAQRGGRV
jgi:hypothetical protein